MGISISFLAMLMIVDIEAFGTNHKNIIS